MAYCRIFRDVLGREIREYVVGGPKSKYRRLGGNLLALLATATPGARKAHKSPRRSARRGRLLVFPRVLCT